MGVGTTYMRIRAYIDPQIFLEAFFNEVTGKTAFALLRGEQRIFGADNSGSWHWHPFDRPEVHLPEVGEISFTEFLERVEERFKNT